MSTCIGESDLLINIIDGARYTISNIDICDYEYVAITRTFPSVCVTVCNFGD